MENEIIDQKYILSHSYKRELNSLGVKITYFDNFVKEDMLQIKYSDSKLLDFGCYLGTFIILVIINNDWQSPALKMCFDDFRKISINIEIAHKFILENFLK